MQSAGTARRAAACRRRPIASQSLCRLSARSLLLCAHHSFLQQKGSRAACQRLALHRRAPRARSRACSRPQPRLDSLIVGGGGAPVQLIALGAPPRRRRSWRHGRAQRRGARRSQRGQRAGSRRGASAEHPGACGDGQHWHAAGLAGRRPRLGQRRRAAPSPPRHQAAGGRAAGGAGELALRRGELALRRCKPLSRAGAGLLPATLCPPSLLAGPGLHRARAHHSRRPAHRCAARRACAARPRQPVQRPSSLPCVARRRRGGRRAGGAVAAAVRGARLGSRGAARPASPAAAAPATPAGAAPAAAAAAAAHPAAAGAASRGPPADSRAGARGGRRAAGAAA